jgi:hypothetical protein
MDRTKSFRQSLIGLPANRFISTAVRVLPSVDRAAHHVSVPPLLNIPDASIGVCHSSAVMAFLVERI